MVIGDSAATDYPELWPTDGRVGGAPDYHTAGPEWIQIGTEGGFLPKPAIIPQQPITWNMDPTMFNVGNVQDHSLLLGSAERADVIVDFSKYAGKTLILYNDAPTAFPALDPRTDYFTNDEDHTDTGGTKSTKAGYGPNTRTVMQIKVAAATPAPAFDLQKLNDAFTTTATQDGVFKKRPEPDPHPGCALQRGVQQVVHGRSLRPHLSEPRRPSSGSTASPSPCRLSPRPSRTSRARSSIPSTVA